MNTAELKLDLFRKIDNLKDSELEKVYQMVSTLLVYSKKYNLSDEERKALDEALECSKKGETYTHDSVMKEAKGRYARLKFK